MELNIMVFNEILTSFFLFMALYFEVFILITFLENFRKISPTPLADISKKNFNKLPSVTIIIPCFNEEKTVSKTVESLLALDYPKEKLNISIVDDGSTDNTWENILKWNKHPQVSAHRKENGGKYTALNFGIKNAKTDLVGCLDADSFVDRDALRKIVYLFQNDKELQAVTPAIRIWQPNSIIRRIQHSEYIYGIFIKKIFSLLNAVHVTPGPFSIFKREAIEKIGYFKHAHNTEDMEIALRLHKNKLKIGNCYDAFVYTVGPQTFRKLHKQRVRWTYGFIRNCIDYKDMFFDKKFGNISTLVMPFSIISLVAVCFILFSTIYNITNSAISKIEYLSAVGWRFNLPDFNFDAFFISTKINTLISLYVLLTTIILLSCAFIINTEKFNPKNVAFYFILYPFIAMTWIIKSLFNLVVDKRPNWR